MIELRTERLLLRTLRPGDEQALVAIANDLEVTRMLTRVPHPYTLDDARERIARVQTEQPASWGVFFGATLIGCAGAEPHLGYFYGKPYWGRGFATEAAIAVLDHAFREPANDVIISGAFEENQASRHVLAKLGFIETGKGMKFSRARDAEAMHIDYRLDRATWLERSARTE